MGVIYFVGCKTCKVKRDLDKFYTMSFGLDVKSREKALEYADKDISKDTFRSGLLVSFMAQHAGHDCTTFSDSGDADDLMDIPEEEIDFWSTSPNPMMDERKD